MLSALGTFLLTAADLFMAMAPYLLFGLTIAGLLHVVIPRSLVARLIGSQGLGAVAKASVLGVPLPLCSCSVLPTATYLRDSGGSPAAVMSFLVSTPQTGVDSIAATWGLLGPFIAIYRAIAALLAGIVAGIGSMLERALGSAAGRANSAGEPTAGEGLADSAGAGASEPGTGDSCSRGECSCGALETGNSADHSLGGRARELARYAFVELLDDLVLPFLFGLGLAALITMLIPPDFFSGRTISTGLPAMLLMVLIGIPMYICATSSIPIAVAFIAAGISPGAAYVFLMAGPATNAATLTVLTRVLGRRQTLVYLVAIVASAIGLGLLLDLLLPASWQLPAQALTEGRGHDHGRLAILASAIFAGLSATAVSRKLGAPLQALSRGLRLSGEM